MQRAVLQALLLCVTLAMLVVPARAQQPQLVPAYPLYCQGPLSTGPAASGAGTTTPFIWAATGAGAAHPGPGQCAWADRAARGTEFQTAGGNVICDFSGALSGAAAGQYIELGVERDPQVGNCMHLSRYLGAVTPPFSGVPALPPFTRQSIASLSAAQITSLRNGIQAMMNRPATDPTSFTFQANIHGTYDAATTSQQTAAWNQCEHGSYFFFAWHRMYLYYFDRILRAAARDPNLVLPYWNWSDPAQYTLPAPFWQPANSSNPLYIANRAAGLNTGNAQLGAGTVDFSQAFSDTAFDSPSGSGASFGGQVSTPEHFTGPHGDLESQPHDVVHVALGGLMQDPNTAAQDPIFWLHHANIDRLWNRWLAQGGGRADPGDAQWLETSFTFYDEAGHAVTLTGSQIVDTVGELNYRYDDDPAAPVPAPAPAPGHKREPEPRILRESVTVAQSLSETAGKRITLDGESARVVIPFEEASLRELRARIKDAPATPLTLRVDDIRYEKTHGVYFEVHIDPAPGHVLSARDPSFVGNLAFFGLKPHAMPGHAMPASRPLFVDFEVSRRLAGILERSPKAINVVFVPRGLFDSRGEPLPVPKQVEADFARVQLLYRR